MFVFRYKWIVYKKEKHKVCTGHVEWGGCGQSKTLKMECVEGVNVDVGMYVRQSIGLERGTTHGLSDVWYYMKW